MPKLSALPEDTAIAPSDIIPFVDDSDTETTKITASNLRDALKDGGGIELDVADLAGGLGTNGQVPVTDGAAVAWREVDSAGIATDAVGASEIDLSITPTWTGQHVFNAGIDIEGDWDVTSVAEAGVDRLLVEGAGVDDPAELMLQAKGASNVARFTATPDASTANFSGITLESNGTHQAIDSIAEGTATALPVQVQMEGTALMEFTTGNDVKFNAITGTPTMASHDHSEGGMATIPNSGLTNSSVTVAGNSVPLGGSTAVAVGDLSNAALPNATAAGQFLIYDATAGQFENATITDSTGISATEADASVTLTLDETVLKDGGAKELDVADLAGGLGTAGQVVTTDGSAVSWGAVGSNGIATDAVGNSELNNAGNFTFDNQVQFSGGLDTRGDVVDDATTIWDSTAGELGSRGSANGVASLDGSGQVPDSQYQLEVPLTDETNTFTSYQKYEAPSRTGDGNRFYDFEATWSNDAAKWRFRTDHLTNADFPDDVIYKWGYNVRREDTTEIEYRQAFEHKYQNQNGEVVAEWYRSFVSADGTVNYRPHLAAIVRNTHNGTNPVGHRSLVSKFDNWKMGRAAKTTGNSFDAQFLEFNFESGSEKIRVKNGINILISNQTQFKSENQAGDFDNILTRGTDAGGNDITTVGARGVDQYILMEAPIDQRGGIVSQENLFRKGMVVNGGILTGSGIGRANHIGVALEMRDDTPRMRFNDEATSERFFATLETGQLRWDRAGGGAEFLFGLDGDFQVTEGDMILKNALDHDGSNVGFYGTTPITQPTTAIAGATFTQNTGTTINDASTFNGYTIQQVVQALDDLGLLT